MSNSTLKIIVK